MQTGKSENRSSAAVVYTARTGILDGLVQGGDVVRNVCGNQCPNGQRHGGVPVETGEGWRDARRYLQRPELFYQTTLKASAS